jgi:transposase
VHASEQHRPDVRRRREIWEHCLPGLDPDRLVFLDESGVNTAMFRRYGRCPRGQRLVDAAPAAHWQSNTLLAGVRLDGVVAPMVLDGPVNGESFAGYVERSLVPELRPGDIVIMDNLPAHKGERVARAIEAAGCRLVYLPPYSPDFNPIEPMWSKVKSIVRKAAARTFEALVDVLRAALLAVTPDDCYGFFCHCGYDATAN